MLKNCVVCGAGFAPRAHNSKTCGDVCRKEFRKQLCRDWRAANPDKQEAACRHWKENNRDRHLAGQRARSQRWRDTHLDEKRAQSRAYRRDNPDVIRAYSSKRTAAFRLVKLLGIYGTEALNPAFEEPKEVLKQREYSRRWKEKAGYVSIAAPIEKQRARSAAHESRRIAANRLVRELSTKGIEALL